MTFLYRGQSFAFQPLHFDSGLTSQRANAPLISADVGKTFRTTVLKHFTAMGVSALDAVILTHPVRSKSISIALATTQVHLGRAHAVSRRKITRLRVPPLPFFPASAHAARGRDERPG